MPTKQKPRPSSKSAKATPAKSRPAPAKKAVMKKVPAKKVAAKKAPAPTKKAAPAAKIAPTKKAAPPPAKVAAPKPAPAKPVAAKAPAAKPKAAAPAPAPVAPPPAPPANTANTSTYLVVLSTHERKGRRFVQLKSPSVLAWFQRGFRLAREGKGWAGDLGGEVRGLDVLFEAVENRKLAVPNTEVELQALLTKYLRAERDLEIEPHFVHVETDDDETEIEYFFFDDTFLESDEALDRLPSPKRRARPIEDDEEEPSEEETFEADDDEDPYTQLIDKLADA